MVETSEAGNNSDANSNSPDELNLPIAAQFRTLRNELKDIRDKMSRLEDPKTFRVADVVNLAVIVIALLIALLTALGLKDRVDEEGRALQSSETRLSAQISASEGRVSSRLDKLDERFTRLDERTTTIEGAKGASHN